MAYKQYGGRFDYVVGNPPYVRIHNLDPETRELIKKEFVFNEGTIDIYLSFFEMGFRMLKTDGILGFITPNSYLHNSSYEKFREYLKNTKAMELLVDFKANKIFNGFSTYTAISIIRSGPVNGPFAYKELKNGKLEKIADIDHRDLRSADWSFANKYDSAFVKRIENDKNRRIKDYFNVQYGFATLRDKIYIGKIKDLDTKTAFFNGSKIERAILKKIVKGSRYRGDEGEMEYIVFPYAKKSGRLVAIEEDELKTGYPLAYQYLSSRKDELLERDMDSGAKWYEFGRSQGIQNMDNEKIVCSTLAKDRVNFYKLPADVMVYSGIFIYKTDPRVDRDMLLNILCSDDFIRYIKITGKDFSGGYKSITSKQIKNFRLDDVAVDQINWLTLESTLPLSYSV